MIPKSSLCVEGQIVAFELIRPYAENLMMLETTPGWKKEVFDFLRQWCNDTDHIVQHSSGTTGTSKEIMLSKQAMLASAEATCRFFSLQQGNNALLCLPVKYIAGKMMVVRALAGGLNLLLTEPGSQPQLPEETIVHFAAMVPLQVMNLLGSGQNLHSVKKLIIGGAAITPELEMQLQQLPSEVYATYGMAETCSHIALRRINGSNPEKSYHVLPGITIALDIRGCLVIDASYLPQPVITNDLVEISAPGSFRWIGRYDNLINSGGIKVVPEELEMLIAEKTGLVCAVIGIPDNRLGQRLTLIAEKHGKFTNTSEVMLELRKILSRNLLPKQILWVDKFPRNNFFKIDRLRLLELVYGVR